MLTLSGSLAEFHTEQGAGDGKDFPSGVEGQADQVPGWT